MSDDPLSTYIDFINRLLVGPGEILLDILKGGRYIGPIRKIPPRLYNPLKSEEDSRWSSGLAAWDNLFKGTPDFLNEISDWLSRDDRINCGYSLKKIRYKKLDVNSPLYTSLISGTLLDEENISERIQQLPEDKQLVLHDENLNVDVLPPDVGIGISQILPVVVASLDKNILFLMIEQPELHVHPSIQLNLGDLFINQIHEGMLNSWLADHKMFIIETHSEHILLRLLRRTRETKENNLPPDVLGLAPEELSVNYIEQTESGLSCHPIRVDKDGDFIDRWPHGFFAERAEELF